MRSYAPEQLFEQARPFVVELGNEERDGRAKILRGSEIVGPRNGGVGIISHPATGQFRDEVGALGGVKVRSSN
jgi:hypothetical protein